MEDIERKGYDGHPLADENFVSLSKRCQTLTEELAHCHDPATRKQLLAQLRNTIFRLDRLILMEHQGFSKE
jgi:hypothetical protein